MLRVDNLDVFHGDAQALDDVSLEIDDATIVAIVGANGAGKTSLIRTIAGMHRPARGRIAFRGIDIGGWESHRVCNLGIGQVAEGRQVFATLSVAENLEIGAMLPRARAGRAKNLERVFALFPLLAERSNQAAGTLSGGEQQMLAIARSATSTAKASLACWSSRMWRSRSSSPPMPTCSRTGGSRSPARARRCWPTTACAGPISDSEVSRDPAPSTPRAGRSSPSSAPRPRFRTRAYRRGRLRPLPTAYRS